MEKKATRKITTFKIISTLEKAKYLPVLPFSPSTALHQFPVDIAVKIKKFKVLIQESFH